MSTVLSAPAERAIPDAMLPVAHRVIGRSRETADTVTLLMEPVAGPAALPLPGQFNMLYAVGIGEVPISVSGIEAGGVLHTIRAVGAVTRALCALEPGASLGLRGPFGTAWGLEEARDGDVVLVAGGIGLAPLRPVVRELLRRRDEFRRVAVLIGARTPEELIFLDEIRSWQEDPRLDVHVTVDQATRSWHGDVGVVTSLFRHLQIDPEVTTAMLCGPEIMMRFAAVEVLSVGVPADRIRLSLERNMQCGIGRCGHCQIGPFFVCMDGPVLNWSGVAPLLARREL
jgi:anaerobic sulfite reductase subunit B